MTSSLKILSESFFPPPPKFLSLKRIFIKVWLVFKCTGYIKLLSPGKGLLISRILLFRTFRERNEGQQWAIFAAHCTQMWSLSSRRYNLIGGNFTQITMKHNAYCGEVKEGGIKIPLGQLRKALSRARHLCRWFGWSSHMIIIISKHFR